MKFSISTSALLLLILTLESQNNKAVVEGQSYDLVRQYGWCKNLTMILYNSTYTPPFYMPDSSVPNNILNDTYFQKMNLSSMSFYDAMNFFRRIYLETNNCSSRFCNCVSWDVIDAHGAYSVVFRNDTNFNQVVSLVELFLEKLKPKLLPYSVLQYSYPFYDSPNLTTLVQFSIKNDYSSNRMAFYNTTSCYGYVDYYTDFACRWEALISNRTVITNYTNSRLEALLQCNLMKPGKCPIEQKRFEAYNYWIQNYPKLTWRGASLLSYLESLISKGTLYKPKLTFDSVSVSSFNDYLYVSTYKKGLKSYQVKTRTFTSVCLDSKQLRVQCKWTLSTLEVVSLVWANFTFMNNVSYYNIQFNMSSLIPIGVSFSNGTVVKDKNGLNMFQYFWYTPWYVDRRVEMFDFNTNTKLSLDQGALYIFSDVNQLKKSTGVLIDGFKNSVITSRRRRRDASLTSSQCDTICDRLLNPKSILVSSSIANHKFSSCVNQCNQ